MKKKELIKSLKKQIKDIENNPKMQSVLKGIENSKIEKNNDFVYVNDLKPNWNCLKNDKCPQCTNELMEIDYGKKMKCVECDFKISKHKYQKIKSKLINKKYSLKH